MESEDFDKLNVRRVADLEERTAGRPMSRRTFLKKVAKIGGAAAIMGVAGWLGVNVLAPGKVPGLVPIKTMTAMQVMLDCEDTDDDWNVDRMKSHKRGDMLYVKDRLTAISDYRTDPVEVALTFETFGQKEAPRFQYDHEFYPLGFGVDKSKLQARVGDVVIFSSRVDRYLVSGETTYGVVWDAYNSTHKNTARRV